MQPIRPFLRLMRLHRPIGIWLLVFPALWAVLLAPGPVQWRLLPAMLFGAVLIRAAGCIVNDLTDRRLDREVARTRDRPLASGAVSRRDALVLLAVLLFDGLLLCLVLPASVLKLALLVLPLIVAYPWMKRLTFWPQAFLGLTFNFGALIGWAATGAPLAAPAFLLYAACFFWTLGYDTLYAIEDMEDDARIGIKSTARRIGTGRRLQYFTGLCYLAMLALLALAANDAHRLGLGFGLGLLGAAIQAAWQCRAARRLEAGSAQAGALFRSNQWLGLMLLGGLALERFFPYLS